MSIISHFKMIVKLFYCRVNNNCKNLKIIEIPDSVKNISSSFDSPSLTVKYKGQEYDASNVKDIYTY